MDTELIDRIDALLPQTQCTRCGYPACRPYAEAIASGEAPINQCPPGGDAGIAALATLLQRASLAMNPANGTPMTHSVVALIDEAVCIGCTKCIQACPVDAIVGAAKLMHTVITDECNGCELCIPPCPVDCISIVATDKPYAPSLSAPQYRQRFEARNQRLQRIAADTEAERQRRKSTAGDALARALQTARTTSGGSA